MKKHLYRTLCLLLLIGFTAFPASAHNADEHNKQLQQVLFGRDNYTACVPSEQRNAISALEDASYLCIDQFNGNGTEQLQNLRDYGVPSLPDSVDSIDFNGNSTHRRYTHLGWVPVNTPSQGNWSARKSILLSTVNKVFDFGFGTDIYVFGWSPIDYTEQCDAFAALLYYIHILGDVESLETLSAFTKEGTYVLPLARAHPGSNNPDILWDLTEEYLPKLFSSQTGTTQYTTCLSALSDIAVKARTLAASTGGINTEEKYAEYRQYILDVIDTLSRYIPALLKNESFFHAVFD